LRTFFIAEVSGGFALRAFDPIGSFRGDGVRTATADSTNRFAAPRVGDTYVVSSAPTFRATGNRQLSLHTLMIRAQSVFTYLMPSLKIDVHSAEIFP